MNDHIKDSWQGSEIKLVTDWYKRKVLNGPLNLPRHSRSPPLPALKSMVSKALSLDL
jgi:hypothetical protein